MSHTTSIAPDSHMFQFPFISQDIREGEGGVRGGGEGRGERGKGVGRGGRGGGEEEEDEERRRKKINQYKGLENISREIINEKHS